MGGAADSPFDGARRPAEPLETRRQRMTLWLAQVPGGDGPVTALQRLAQRPLRCGVLTRLQQTLAFDGQRLEATHVDVTVGDLQRVAAIHPNEDICELAGSLAERPEALLEGIDDGTDDPSGPCRVVPVGDQGHVGCSGEPS